MNATALAAQLSDAVGRLRASMDELDDRSRRAAEMDRAWRLARAQSYATTSGTVGERDAAVERETAHLRYEAKLAEDLRTSALEAVRSNRTIVSAFQSVVAMNRAEAELAKWGPSEGAA